MDLKIEKLVEKYAIACGKPALTVHALRYSFATRYHKDNNDVPIIYNIKDRSETMILNAYLKGVIAT